MKLSSENEGTFEDAEIENLRSWQKLSFKAKLDANEEMNALFDAVIKEKRAQKKPFIDPATQKITF
ncbi:MAG: hypothetical protein AAF212_12640 [Verrucomicrobiota bacterium]